MTSQPPPDFTASQLDFSQFHPLDHRLWQCSGYPGGKRTHLQYRWQFQWRDEIGRWLLCPLGRHAWVTWWRRGDDGRLQEGDSRTCQRCGTDEGPHANLWGSP